MNSLIVLISVSLAVALSGIMAGVYLTFSTFVMKSLAVIPREAGMAAMQSINRVILSSLFMPLFFGSTLLSAALGIWGGFRWSHPGGNWLVAGSIVYVVGMFVCTAVCNVPLNTALDEVNATTAEAQTVWLHYLVRWTQWNHVRSAASVAACACFLAALCLMIREQ